MGKGDRGLTALTGAAFVVLVIIGFAIGGEPPTASEDSAQDIVDFYVDNDSRLIAGAALAAFGATLFVFFGGYLRRLLRASEGEQGMLSAVMFAGVIIFATGLAIDGTITFALVDTAGDVDPAATQALAALFNNDFLPLAVGLQVFLLGLGLSALRGAAVPKWLGWAAIVLSVVAVTPIGFVAFLGTGLLILVLSVMLSMRARAAT